MNGEAGSLGCPRCGAPAAPEALHCEHCRTPLALVACPACFRRIFQGARFCSFCGSETARHETEAPARARACPRCRTALARILVGPTALDECRGCGGLWSERAAFERILADGEAQASVLGRPSGSTFVPVAQPYVPCPDCGRLMNRLNFARCSGVIVDVCRDHGTWLDRDELQRIAGFVRAGGLARARAKEREDLELERRRLRQQELELAAVKRSSGAPGAFGGGAAGGSTLLDAHDLLDVVGVLGSSVFDLFD